MTETTQDARHLAAGSSDVTLCGIDRGSVSSVHPSKARKTDCDACRNRWREINAKKPKTPEGIRFAERSADTREATVDPGPYPSGHGAFPEPQDDPAPDIREAAGKEPEGETQPKEAGGMPGPSPEDEIEARVLAYRRTMVPDKKDPTKSVPMPHREIEQLMGFKPQGGNRPWRICKKHGVK